MCLEETSGGALRYNNNNMATQFGRFRILFRKSFIENVYINILKNIFFCNSFYLIIFLKHLRCFFTNAYGVRICSACGGNSRRHFGRTMCLHTKDTSTGQPTAGRSKLPSAAGVFRTSQRVFVNDGQNRLSFHRQLFTADRSRYVVNDFCLRQMKS